METKWKLTGIVLICAIICSVIIVMPLVKNPATSAPQGSASGFVLERALPESESEAPSYHVMKKESIFEGSEKLMTTKKIIPTTEEAPALAEKTLESYGGLPEDAVLVKVEQVFLEQYNTDTESVEERYPQFTQVIYNQVINGSPVIGPGAEINICLGENGDMLQIEKAWRHVEYGGDVPIISASEAFDKLVKRDLLVIPQSSLKGITISEVKLGYYAEDREHDQEMYSPVWIFYGSKNGGQPYPYLVDARRS